jgi:putative FmdB family regulatory protein
MPVYTYRREDGTTFDFRQSFADEPLKTDPQTGQPVVRIVQAAGIIFKGSGFYINDSKGASKSSTLPAAGKSTDEGAGTAEAKPAKAEPAAPAPAVQSAAD